MRHIQQAWRTVREWVQRGVLALIRVYQRWLSPMFPPTCRYYPSCSTYAVMVIERHGLIKGLLLAFWRLLRCNPLSPGGVDHPPPPGRWRDDLPRDVAHPQSAY